mmetsp:Transcript_11852/g.30262  ORF Transcript_11852/g.30262 Transcript_11852/m.30262 type:complete len:200 (-) Transcript_11852:502-1101(-)
MLDGFLEADPREPERLDDDHPPFVVEVVHDVLEALVLLADEVLGRHLAVVEGDVRRARGPHAGALHLLRHQTGCAALHEDKRHATHARATCSARNGEVIGHDAVGDPLLFSVDDEVPAVAGPGRGALQVGHVAAGIRLGDAQADPLLPAKARGHHLLLKVTGSEQEDGRQTDGESSLEPPHDAAGSAPGQFVDHDELVE